MIWLRGTAADKKSERARHGFAGNHQARQWPAGRHASREFEALRRDAVASPAATKPLGQL